MLPRSLIIAVYVRSGFVFAHLYLSGGREKIFKIEITV